MKKEAKNFSHLMCAADDRLGSKGKSFLVLFSKKELLSSPSPNPPRWRTPGSHAPAPRRETR
jgi:hypothetical protein